MRLLRAMIPVYMLLVTAMGWMAYQRVHTWQILFGVGAYLLTAGVTFTKVRGLAAAEDARRQRGTAILFALTSVAVMFLLVTVIDH